MRMGIFWLGNILAQPGFSIYQQTHGERDIASWQRLGRMETWIQSHEGRPYLETGGHPGQLRDSGKPGSLWPKGAWSPECHGAHTPRQTSCEGSAKLEAIETTVSYLPGSRVPPACLPGATRLWSCLRRPARCHRPEVTTRLAGRMGWRCTFLSLHQNSVRIPSFFRDPNFLTAKMSC